MSGLDARGIEAEGLVEAPFPDVRHEFRVFLAEQAFDHAVQRGNESPGREIGGVLVGEACRDEAGPYVRIDATIDALHADEQGAELTFTHATWEHIHKEMDARHQGRRIVGWYHTHPGFGIFLSDRDVFIHRSFFNLPFQVALVYDPKSREHGVFAWRDNEPRRMRRHWVGAREHIWDGAPVIQAQEGPTTMDANPQTAAPARSDAPPPDLPPDRFGLALMGVIVLLLGGAIGWWLGSGGSSADAEALRKGFNTQVALKTQENVANLRLELLVLMRELTGGEGLRVPLDNAIARVDASLKALEEAKAPPAALDDLRAARERLVTLRNDAVGADELLKRMAQVARRDQGDPRVSAQAAVLGQVCLAVADLTPDKAAARRLLLNAMALDPGQKEVYQRKLDELGR